MENKEMEEELNYIVKYKNKSIKIRKKYKEKITLYLKFVLYSVALLSIFPIIFLKFNIVQFVVTLFFVFYLLFDILADFNCYLYFDKSILKIQDKIVSYKILVNDLLNIDIERDTYERRLKIRYIKNNRIKTIKINLISYGYRTSAFRYDAKDIRRFLSLFKTEKECLKEKSNDIYLTINRNYSNEQIKQLLEEANKRKRYLSINMGHIIFVSVIFLVFALYILIYLNV